MPIAEMIPSSPDQGSSCVGKRCVLHSCLQGHVWARHPPQDFVISIAEGIWGLTIHLSAEDACTYLLMLYADVNMALNKHHAEALSSLSSCTIHLLQPATHMF